MGGWHELLPPLGLKTTASSTLLAWENSRHLATVPLVSPPNDVWETRAEIPYWWRVTTQIWVVLLIGRAAWEIWFIVSQTSFGGKTSGSVAKCRLFSENGNKIDDCLGKDNFFTLWSSPPLWNVWFARHTSIRCPLVSHPVHGGKLLSRAVISSCCCHADLKIIFKSHSVNFCFISYMHFFFSGELRIQTLSPSGFLSLLLFKIRIKTWITLVQATGSGINYNFIPLRWKILITSYVSMLRNVVKKQHMKNKQN